MKQLRVLPVSMVSLKTKFKEGVPVLGGGQPMLGWLRTLKYGSNFNDFSENEVFQTYRFWCIFEDEGAAGTLLGVFKMHGLQQQKKEVSIEI